MGSVDTIITAYFMASAIFLSSASLSPAPPDFISEAVVVLVTSMSRSISVRGLRSLSDTYTRASK